MPDSKTTEKRRIAEMLTSPQEWEDFFNENKCLFQDMVASVQAEVMAAYKFKYGESYD